MEEEQARLLCYKGSGFLHTRGEERDWMVEGHGLYAAWQAYMEMVLMMHTQLLPEQHCTPDMLVTTMCHQ